MKGMSLPPEVRVDNSKNMSLVVAVAIAMSSAWVVLGVPETKSAYYFIDRKVAEALD